MSRKGKLISIALVWAFLPAAAIVCEILGIYLGDFWRAYLLYATPFFALIAGLVLFRVV